MCLHIFLACMNPVDLVFLLDASGSIGDTNYQVIKTFVSNLVQVWGILPFFLSTNHEKEENKVLPIVMLIMDQLILPNLNIHLQIIYIQFCLIRQYTLMLTGYLL